MDSGRCAGPLGRECVGDLRHALLVATAVADEDDSGEPMHFQAVRDVGERRLEGLLPLLILFFVPLLDIFASVRRLFFVQWLEVFAQFWLSAE